eukprot:8590888-Pyramimonas_sp.AAC.1
MGRAPEFRLPHGLSDQDVARPLTHCIETHGNPGFPAWREPVGTPAAPHEDDPGAEQDIPRDPGSVAPAAPDQETMVQIIAEQKGIDRNIGDNEA